ncbi:hypothetical protein Catovirus_1_368 [Catovirus CTV1]|uniref:Isopenicillin N synthase-like Fe(2+) 2OG dioxygenase domain-containing protein n=1 Tax=Catovirus CTV1 TaxID=1977631 RepID=A0A1V0S9J0_9VIRU|nr:hypothetical protein Catovirus_1_368 [Catovirus CTV1]
MVIPPESKNVAILWAGKAANMINQQIKVGIHRVVNVPHRTRISIWHEICMATQEHKEYANKHSQEEFHLIDPVKFENKLGYPITKTLKEEKKDDNLFDPYGFGKSSGYPIMK